MSEIKTTMEELEDLHANSDAWPNDSLKEAAGGIIDIFKDTGTLDADYFDLATNLVLLVNQRVDK